MHQCKEAGIEYLPSLVIAQPTGPNDGKLKANSTGSSTKIFTDCTRGYTGYSATQRRNNHAKYQLIESLIPAPATGYFLSCPDIRPEVANPIYNSAL